MVNFIPAICPQCSASLDIDGSESFTTCSHCKSNIFIKNESSIDQDLDRTLELAKIAEQSQNFSEAYSLYSQVLLRDITNVDAWRGKGYAAGMLSNLISDRFHEAISYFNQSLKFAKDDAQDSLKKEYALLVYDIGKRFFNHSFEHFLKFSTVRSAEFEHADRCREIIGLCEYAISLDDNIFQAKSFINDLANRCVKISYLDPESKSFFARKKEEYSAYAKKQESSSSDFSAPHLVLVILILAANYFLTNSLLEKKSFLIGLLGSFILLIPEAIIFFKILLYILERKNKKLETMTKNGK